MPASSADSRFLDRKIQQKVAELASRGVLQSGILTHDLTQLVAIHCLEQYRLAATAVVDAARAHGMTPYRAMNTDLLDLAQSLGDPGCARIGGAVKPKLRSVPNPASATSQIDSEVLQAKVRGSVEARAAIETFTATLVTSKNGERNKHIRDLIAAAIGALLAKLPDVIVWVAKLVSHAKT